MRRLDDKVCVITGAASPIGQAVAERLADEGALVVGVDQHDHSVGDRSIRADLTVEREVSALFDGVVQRFGRLDVLYNNAGMMDPTDRSALATDLETWHRVLEANLTPIYLSCKHGVRRMLETEPRGGSVINATSFLAGIGAATAPMSFSSSKAAVVQLSRDLGVHLARSGVRVNAVLFGPIETPAQRAMLEADPDTLAKRRIHWPMGRYGTLEEAAGAVAFLASDDSGFMTAATLSVDGGIAHAFTIPD